MFVTSEIDVTAQNLDLIQGVFAVSDFALERQPARPLIPAGNASKPSLLSLQCETECRGARIINRPIGVLESTCSAMYGEVKAVCFGGLLESQKQTEDQSMQKIFCHYFV